VSGPLQFRGPDTQASIAVVSFQLNWTLVISAFIINSPLTSTQNIYISCSIDVRAIWALKLKHELGINLDVENL
jgi:hypothetical protein